MKIRKMQKPQKPLGVPYGRGFGRLYVHPQDEHANQNPHACVCNLLQNYRTTDQLKYKDESRARLSRKARQS
jgi:hypothetical protein